MSAIRRGGVGDWSEMNTNEKVAEKKQRTRNNMTRSHFHCADFCYFGN